MPTATTAATVTMIAMTSSATTATTAIVTMSALTTALGEMLDLFNNFFKHLLPLSIFLLLVYYFVDRKSVV